MLCHDLKVCYKSSPLCKTFLTVTTERKQLELPIYKAYLLLNLLMDMRDAGVHFIYVYKEKQRLGFTTLLYSLTENY